MPTDTQTLAAIKSALTDLGGAQSLDAVRQRLQQQTPGHHNPRRIGTLLRGYSFNMLKARDRHPDFGQPIFKQTKRGFFSLA